jgi:hypothetical protein
MPIRREPEPEQEYQPGAAFPRQIVPEKFRHPDRDPRYPYTLEDEARTRRILSGEGALSDSLTEMLKYMFTGH